MEKHWGGLGVEKKDTCNVWGVGEICTKSCREAYEDYMDNGGKICPHYTGRHFVEMFFDVFNWGWMESTRCIDVVAEICDLFKKDESDWK